MVRDAVRGLCEPLTRFILRSWELADDFFVSRDMPEDDHRGGRAHLARQLLRRELRLADSLGGWRLPKKCTPNSEVKLVKDAMSLKVLRPGVGGAVPAPGVNLARMRYYRNPELTLFGADASNLIAAWSISAKTHQPIIRIVRPTSIWKSLRPEEIDIDFFLPASPGQLDELSFVPSDEGLELPFFVGDEDEEEGGDVSPNGG